MKNLIFLLIAAMSLSCSKDDDKDCECYYYEEIDRNASCEFEERYGDELRNEQFLHEQPTLERYQFLADQFKCE